MISHTETFGVVVTSYHETRKEQPGEEIIRALEIPIRDPRVQEIVVTNDGTPDFPQLCALLQPLSPKIKLFQNPANYGVFGAKLQALRNATADRVVLLDSDNYFDTAYLDKLFSVPWQPTVILAPSQGLPRLDYREKVGAPVTLRSFRDLLGWRPMLSFMNTGNQCLDRKTYLNVMQSWNPHRIDLQQPDYFGLDRSDRYWLRVYDAQDSFFFNKQWLLSGHSIQILDGWVYQHTIPSTSAYNAAPEEKSAVASIYMLELLDAAEGKSFLYRYVPSVDVLPMRKTLASTRPRKPSAAYFHRLDPSTMLIQEDLVVYTETGEITRQRVRVATSSTQPAARRPTAVRRVVKKIIRRRR